MWSHAHSIAGQDDRRADVGAGRCGWRWEKRLSWKGTLKRPTVGAFGVLDDATRQPVANHPYTVRAADGRVIEGKTDANGFTEWLESHEASSLTFSQPGSQNGS